MTNRMTLVGVLAAMTVALPTVAAADNPWRADPQARGDYAPSTLQQSLQSKRPPELPKYAPLDGRVDDGESKTPYGFQPFSHTGYPNTYGYGPGRGVGPYGGGFGHPGIGYPGAGYPNLGAPYGGGLWPGVGGLNGLGGPLSWMPWW
ncbi:hypothetical protein V5T82_10020 [Magnetovibrio sp. PR-2]|uniref:hypothetical protein n=1 Tax=Magnetovibrio sp. PR-2 TaxID=3120356 RepID=UPI002FCE499D